MMIHRILPWVAFLAAVALGVLLIYEAKAAPVPPAVQRWHALVEAASVEVWGHDLHAALHGSQIEQESAGRPDVYSRVGACGLMQFMPATWREQSSITGQFGDCRNPALNIAHGIAYTRRLHGMQQRTASGCALWRQVLAAYNWGIGSVRRAIRRHGDAWLDRAPRETRHYVPTILARESVFIAAGWSGEAKCAT